jgi:hypothetical protein
MKLEEVKQNMHKNVMYDGSIYRLQSCVLWLDEKAHKFKYSVVLLDKNKNSTIDVPIEKVEVI